MARAEARGQEVSATVYENAMVAAAEGMSAVNSSLDAQYDKEYALIQLIQDSTERQQAMDALNAKYNNDRRAAAIFRLHRWDAPVPVHIRRSGFPLCSRTAETAPHCRWSKNRCNQPDRHRSKGITS